MPSWDGHILFYENEKPNVTGNEHRISVQIKGLELKKEIEAKAIKYKLELTHLNNYYRDGGVLFIVVAYHIKGCSISKHMYAKVLLPIDIIEIRTGKENQKSLTIQLNHVPNYDKLIQLCHLFYNNRAKQALLLDSHPRIQPQVQSNILISYIPDNHKYPLPSPFFNTEQKYVYIVQNGINIPISNSCNIQIEEKRIAIVECTDIYKESFEAFYRYTQNTTTIEIQDVILVTQQYIMGKAEITMRIEFDLDKSVYSNSICARLLKSILISSNLRINGKDIISDSSKPPISETNSTHLETINFILHVRKICTEADIDTKRIMIRDVYASYHYFQTIAHALTHGYTKSIENANEQKGLFVTRIGMRKMHLAYESISDTNTEGYRIFDYFKNNLDIKIYTSIIDKPSERIPVNKWLLPKIEDIPYIIVDREQMVSELGAEVALSDIDIEIITLYVLRLIKSYDEAKINDDLLFANQLSGILPKSNPSIINSAQIKIRMGLLADADKEELKAIKAHGDNIEVCCACILLGDSDGFCALYNRLSDVERAAFHDWPIKKLACDQNFIFPTESVQTNSLGSSPATPPALPAP